ncbi:thiamine phosphate synthase [Litoribacillus peritrichatus]|uniref:Thiamine-phosphate synthase n=1 Tax=Litoribacillus peritrichatus TaxID=718191 RepID=A0ABP7NEW6_9GAMM
MNQLQISGIYAITDPNLLTSEQQLLDGVAQALAAGVSIIQYRDKQATQAQKLFRAKAITELCNQHQAKCIINDSLSLALAANAHGVHLGQTDGSIAQARAALPNDAIVGVTCHDDLQLAIKAQNEGASYVAFGRFFPSNTKPQAKPAKISVLFEAKQQLSIPVVAIGGINQHNIDQIIRTGVDSIAIIDAIFGQNDIRHSAQQLVHEFLAHEFNHSTNERSLG